MLKRFLRRTSRFLLRQHEAIHHRIDVALSRSAVEPYRLREYRRDALTRIVHVNGNFAVGGSSQLIIDLIERLSDTYAQEVVVPDAPNPPPYQPVDLHVVPMAAIQWQFEAWARKPPAAVHIHYWIREGDEFHPLALWYDAMFRMCERLGVPVIQNVNVPTYPHPSPAVAHNVFVSGYVRNAFDPGRVPSSVVYPGSNFAHFSASATTPDNVLGMVYRLDPDKLNERSIEVFIKAAQIRPGIRCLIVGGGHYLELYQRLVREAGLERRFIFTGYVSYDKLPSLYHRMSVVVAPVHNESFGQVTPFAMSMGLPVAGFDIGALEEQLGSKETLAPAGDVARLVELIVGLCDDPPRRRALGEVNRKRAHDLFSVETMVSNYQRLYDNVLSTAS